MIAEYVYGAVPPVGVSKVTLPVVVPKATCTGAGAFHSNEEGPELETMVDAALTLLELVTLLPMPAHTLLDDCIEIAPGS